MTVGASAIAPETEPGASLYDRLHDIETWRSIAPELTVSARLELDRHAPLDAPSCLTEQRIGRMKSEGHFATAPLLDAARVARMASGVERVRAAGLHELCALVYDEFWISLREASGIPESLLGPGYRLVPMPYVNYVAHDDNAAGFGPHRDRYDDPLTLDGMPTVITLWFALTDASPERACLYVLPTSRDRNFPGNLRAFQIGNVQDIRAVPVEAGAIVCFNQAILPGEVGTADMRRDRGSASPSSSNDTTRCRAGTRRCRCHRHSASRNGSGSSAP